jgi:hypothetical protein
MFRAGICLLLLILSVPLVSAVVDSATIPRSTDPRYEDRPEAIASLKTHIAYVGGDQNDRMEGIIRYIDTISNGTGTIILRQIQDDYLVTASSIPLMQTSAEISQAREDLQVQSRLFSEENKARMLEYKGSSPAMKASIRAIGNATDAGRPNSTTGSLWLRNESARLTLFNRESDDRKHILSDLGKQGINTTFAKNISDQIDAQRSNLRGSLTNKSSAALKSTNAIIRTLNREFRENIADTRAAMAIQMKRDAVMAIR